MLSGGEPSVVHAKNQIHTAQREKKTCLTKFGSHPFENVDMNVVASGFVVKSVWLDIGDWEVAVRSGRII